MPAPLATAQQALRVAAEHYSFCHDNFYENPATLTDYAASLVGPVGGASGGTDLRASPTSSGYACRIVEADDLLGPASSGADAG